MSEYRIEKVRRHVSVAIAGGRTVVGDVFLQPTAPYRTGPQDPGELFNDADPFVPLATHGEDLVLLAKEQIVTVQFEPDAADTLLEGVAETAVDVVFADGSTASGLLRLETRADRPRLLDYLNDEAQRFLTLRSARGICLVNRRLIAQVRQRR